MFKAGDKVRVISSGKVAVVVCRDKYGYIACWFEDERIPEWFQASGLELIDKPKQTLFESAKDAPDGTRFKLMGQEFKKFRHSHGDWSLIDDRDVPVNTCHMDCTDFEIIPSGPQKAEKIPAHLVVDYNRAQKQIADLLKWEGARIEGPVGGHGKNNRILVSVTYDTINQRDAALKDLKP